MTAIKIVKNEKGATSVLVIFMLVILITLGSFAITAAAANIRLSGKTVTWNNTYYLLDGEAEIFLSKLDRLLYNAENEAIQKSGTSKEMFAVSYNDIVKANISSLSDEYAGISLLPSDVNPSDGVQIGSIRISFNPSTTMSDENEAKSNIYEQQLTVGISIPLPDYTEDGLTLIKSNISQKRYLITDWIQHQTPFEYTSFPKIEESGFFG